MPEDDFQRTTQTFDCTGINLTVPVDRLPEGKYRLLDNVRPYGRGRIQGRQGVSLLTGSFDVAPSGPAHSLFSWDDPIPSPTGFSAFNPRMRVVMSGTSLWEGTSVNFVQLSMLAGTFSGRPNTFVVSDSERNPRPWTFIGDFSRLAKVNTNFEGYQVGISPPNFAPVAAIDSANPNGPDVGNSPNPYIYAWRARADSTFNTGCVSNLGPAMRIVNGLSPSSTTGGTPASNILITLTQAHPDNAIAPGTGQVEFMDLFRWGGSLPVWLYVGTVKNIVGSTILDTFSDSAIVDNEQADLDDNQPFLSVDNSLSGVCTVTPGLGTGLGCTMTITSGDVFRPYDATGYVPYYTAGFQINISGNLFTAYRSPDDTITVELLEDSPFPGLTTGLNFWIFAPEMARQPLPFLWGPFGGGLTGTFTFGCGDPQNLGTLYWTKGNHIEAHPATNSLQITSSGEALMNGCLYNGTSFVFSTKRLFQIYPTLGQVSDFVALEVPNSKGLFAHWAMCVTPHGIAFLAKDGIYLTTGGEPVSLTDDDLYPLFPQESQGSASGFPVIDGLTGTTFAPPDFTQPDTFRLSYGDGFLKFTYIDTDAIYRTLVYQFELAAKGWISRDTYNIPVVCDYFESLHTESTGESLSEFLMGGTDGNVYISGGADDNGVAISGHIRTGSVDNNDPRPRKLYGDVGLSLDAECETFDVKVGFDEFSFLSSLSITGTNLHGRHSVLGDINDGQGQYSRNIGLDITWTAMLSQPVLYYWVPTHVLKPELTALRVTNWSDDGYPGAKFVQGFIIRLDTLGATRTFDVLSDGGVIEQSFTVTATNEQEQAFSLDHPFVSHLLRVHPTDANFWRIMGLRWIWEPLPEAVLVWETQETTYDFEGYHSHRDAYIGIEAPADVTWTVTEDGTPTVYTITNTGGLYMKPYIVLEPMKGKFAKHRLESAQPFRLYVKDSEVRVKQWGSDGPYVVKQPFGNISRTQGATI